MIYKLHISGNKIVNKNSLFESLVNLEDGFYNIFVEKENIGRPKYFFYRDIIADYLGYGTNKEKKELHDTIKSELLPIVFKDPENLNTDNFESITEYSTKYLSDKGWFKFNECLTLWAMNKFEILLK